MAAVQAAGLVETLQGERSFAVFAPTDDAFAALPEGTVESLLKPENKDQLTKILTCHTVSANAMPDAIMKMADDGTGWPSFHEALPDAVRSNPDHSLFATRTEVHRRRCGGHLGHIFDGGPPPCGKRHCINGVALRFVPGQGAAG